MVNPRYYFAWGTLAAISRNSLDKPLCIWQSSSQRMRTAPNVIITGTPGVGKTVHCEQLAQEIGLKHLSVNQVAKDRDCYETYDEERKSWVVDEDKVRWS